MVFGAMKQVFAQSALLRAAGFNMDDYDG